MSDRINKTMSDTENQANTAEGQPELTAVAIWTSDPEKPPVEGFYATHYCWDPIEGSSVGSDYFHDNRWESNYPVFQWAGPFDTEEDAVNWADENDCSF